MDKIFIGFIVVSFSWFTACQENVLFQERIDISESIWKHNDTLKFKVDISDTVQLYDLFFTVENSPEYSILFIS